MRDTDGLARAGSTVWSFLLLCLCGGDFRLSLLQSSLRRFFRGVDHSGRIGLLAPITGGVRERQAVRGRLAMRAW
eukprot:scaffold13214_cov77-Phaeocystis_antarctica.AAC.1